MAQQPEAIQHSATDIGYAEQHTARIEAAGCTAVGQVRPRNEDQFLVATLRRALRVRSSSVAAERDQLSPCDDATLLVVADGMGGHASGDIASQVAVRSVLGYLRSVIPWFDASALPNPHRESLPGVRQGLLGAVACGDVEVRRAAETNGRTGMGTTLTIAYLHYPQLYVAHVGDSRCYLLRKSELFQLTQDHTMAEAMRAHGSDNSEEAWQHVLTQALGGAVQAVPELRRARLWPGDALLLCSDGVTAHLPDEDIAEMLRQPETAADMCLNIVNEANARGGRDNITAVVAHVVGPADE